MNDRPIYLICASTNDGYRFKASRAALRLGSPRLVVVTEVDQLRRVPDGFAFHIVSPPKLDLWAYVAEHGGADVAPGTWEGAGR